MTLQRLRRFTALAFGGIVLIAGCGPMPAPTPTQGPTSAPSQPPVQSTPPVAIASPAASPATLGDLAANVNAAWSKVTSYRITFTGASMMAQSLPGSPVASPAATPQATPVGESATALVSVREVAPGGQRQTVSGLGADDHEAILSGEQILIRGPLVTQIDPAASSASWIAIDAEDVPADSRLAFLLGGLPAPPPSPLAGVPQRLWPQALRDLGTSTFDGRECRSYAAADTITQTGTRVDFTIAVDPTGLPCFIETSSGGISLGREEYTEIDGDLDIVAPSDATPIAALPAALATPAAHD